MMATSRRRRSATPQIEALENIISLSTTNTASLWAYQSNSNSTYQSSYYGDNANATAQQNVAAIQQAGDYGSNSLSASNSASASA